jgi:glycosyltransferase involved in cell wall biosynthesis
MSFSSFRRNPSRYLRKCRPRFFGKFLSCLFELCNRRDVLADFLSDPRSTLIKLGFVSARSASSSAKVQISVIMATRNNEKTLFKSIQSILDQTHGRFELLIVDDCSTDGSASVIAEIAEYDGRVKFFQNVTRLGTGASRNIGLKEAVGAYITFQDGDDFSAPDRLERQLDALHQYPEKRVCLCNYVRVDQDRRRLLINDSRVMKCIISMMFPREEALGKIGYFLSKSLGEDAEYYERLKIAFGVDCEVLVFGTLYEALFSEVSSLFSSAVVEKRKGNSVRYRRTADAEENWRQIVTRLEMIRNGVIDIHVPYAQP